MVSNSDERLMSVDEVATMLGYHRRTVYMKVEANEIPHIRIGKSIRFSRADLTEWLDARKEKVA